MTQMMKMQFYTLTINKIVLIILIMALTGYLQGSSIAEATTAAVHSSSTARQAPNGAMIVAQRLPPPRVRLNKCCQFSELLDLQQNCVAGNSAQWVPPIFLAKNRTYYEPKGKSPKFMTFSESVRPIILPGNQTNETSPVADISSCSSSNELELFIGDNNIILFSNGSLFLLERAQLIPPHQYCVDNHMALVCFPRTAADIRQKPLLRIRKCCGKQGSYDAATKSCHFTNEKVAVEFKLPLNESIYQTVYGFPECHDAASSFAIAGDWHEELLNPTDGTLNIQQKSFASSDYCLEHLREQHLNSTKSRIKVFTCLHHFAGTGPSADAPVHTSVSPTGVRNVGSSNDHLEVAALNVGLVISVVFLAATLVASYLMPSVHHVLHWRCQIYYVFCLFVGDFLLAFSQLTNSLELGSVQCALVASAMHFFFLAAFFWLNTMCFNIWWTFRDFRPSSLERNQELLRLRLYSAYAWGIPLLITFIAACVDQISDTQLLRPEFGVRSCWFSGEHLTIFAYFFGPVGILLCANIALFISTTHQLTCGLWKRDDVKSSTEKTALSKVCLKLVVVMGVTWIADIISWLIGGPHSVWFFTDLINALQGVFIFIVVGCQPQVWAACKRYCCPRSRQEITNTTNGVQHSSSSQGLPSLAGCGGEITQNTSIHGGLTTSTISAGNGIQYEQNEKHQQKKIPMETVC